MRRIAPSLILLALAPAAAAAQTPYPLGRLVPLEFAQAPDTVPRGPAGDYPEDWAKCGNGHRPEAQLYPHELDPARGRPAQAPNPLAGTKWFVDRMEPALPPVGAARREAAHRHSGRRAVEPAAAGALPPFGRFAAACRRGAPASSTGAVRPAGAVPDDGRDAPPGPRLPARLPGRRSRGPPHKWYDQFAEPSGRARGDRVSSRKISRWGHDRLGLVRFQPGGTPARPSAPAASGPSASRRSPPAWAGWRCKPTARSWSRAAPARGAPWSGSRVTRRPLAAVPPAAVAATPGCRGAAASGRRSSAPPRRTGSRAPGAPT